jgi:hypothetical protein
MITGDRLAILEGHAVFSLGATAMYVPMIKAAERWERDAKKAPDGETKRMWMAAAAELRAIAKQWEKAARAEAERRAAK